MLKIKKWTAETLEWQKASFCASSNSVVLREKRVPRPKTLSVCSAHVMYLASLHYFASSPIMIEANPKSEPILLLSVVESHSLLQWVLNWVLWIN